MSWIPFPWWPFVKRSARPRSFEAARRATLAHVPPTLTPTTHLAATVGGNVPFVLLRDCHHMAVSISNSSTLAQAQGLARILARMTEKFAKVQR